MAKEKEDIHQLALIYYSRKDVQEAIINFCKNREVVPRYVEGFGKRPDALEYANDLMQQVRKGATSFHCSEELWQNPLEISTEMRKEELDEARSGWDLLIDIDSKYLDYSKIMANLLVKALEFHGIKNLGIKFSGSKGFHIIIPWKGFPELLNEQETRKLFPEVPRAISLYLHQLIKKELIDEITKMSGNKSYIKDFESAEKVAPDIILVSSRHLFRCPYSLHEKTHLASIVIDKRKILDFQPQDANPLKVQVLQYSPEIRKNEARELVLQALDWYKENKPEKKPETDFKKIFEEIEIDKSQVVLAPSISKILEGMKDGKKRALFILLNYFRALNFSKQEIEKKIEEWNKKNTPQLKEGYIISQLDWAFRNKKVLPPNYDKPFYSAIGIFPTEEEIRYKNPVSYTIKRMWRGGKKESKKSEGKQT